MPDVIAQPLADSFIKLLDSFKYTSFTNFGLTTNWSRYDCFNAEQATTPFLLRTPFPD